MIPTQTQVAAHARGFIKVLQAYVVKEFDLNVDDMIFKFNFTKRTNNFGTGGNHMKQGKFVGFMNLNLFPLVNYEVVGYAEYARLTRFFGIGSFKTNDWQIWLEALMCHEMAHVVQYMLPRSTSKLRLGDTRYVKSGRKRLTIKMVADFQGLGPSEDGHGSFFRAIYARFRREFINNKVTATVHKISNFKGEDQEPVVLKVRKEVDHPMIGTEFTYKGETFKVTTCFPRMRTYPLLAIGQVSGKRVRFSPLSVTMYKSATVSAKRVG